MTINGNDSLRALKYLTRIDVEKTTRTAVWGWQAVHREVSSMSASLIAFKEKAIIATPNKGSMFFIRLIVDKFAILATLTDRGPVG